MANLRRTRDGEGYYGSMIEAIRENPDPKAKDRIERKTTDKPILGWALRVGTPFAGTYSTRDWWMTTLVTKILEEDVQKDYHYYKFETGNSTYEFWAGNVPEEKFDWK